MNEPIHGPGSALVNPLARFPEIQAVKGRHMLPMTLIGGFLGAGKTTLLNSLLNQGDGRRLAVLVNDFGELNIDARLIVKVEGQQIELANGCICCSIRDDLVAGIERLLESDPPPDQVLIETSGVSDPINVNCAINQAEVRRKVYIENMVTVVDAVHALDAKDRDYQDLFERQVRGAFMIVLNRTEIAGAEQSAKVRAMIQHILPGATIIDSEKGSVSLPMLLGEARLGQSTFRPLLERDDRAHPFSSMIWRTDRAVDRKAFTRVMRELAHSVYRAKGFINFRNYPLSSLYQKVGSLETCVDGGAWGNTQPMTELVLIGEGRGFDEDQIWAVLESCTEAAAPALAAAPVS